MSTGIYLNFYINFYCIDIIKSEGATMSNKKQVISDSKASKDAITIAIENNTCGICRAMGYPICKGHGGGSGSSSGSDSEKKDTVFTSYQVASTENQVNIIIQKFNEAKKNFMQTQLFADRTIGYEAGTLSVESDKLHGNLTFRVKPGLPKGKIHASREFFNAIEIEFDEFKNQLAEQGISSNNFTAVIVVKGNELAIHVPNPKYYDAFIKHLESKNLLPIPNSGHEEKKESFESIEKDKRQVFNPTPFSTRLEKK